MAVRGSARRGLLKAPGSGAARRLMGQGVWCWDDRGKRELGRGEEEDWAKGRSGPGLLKGFLSLFSSISKQLKSI